MRILLDESLPRRLGAELAGHSVTTVQAAGWSAVSNGELLKLAAGRFDVLLTADQNLQFQQNLSALPIPVIVLAAPTNKIEDLRPLMPELVLKLGSLAPGSYVRPYRSLTRTGEKSYVFSCFKQDQPLDQVDFGALAQRPAQNGVQEKLTALWIGRCLKQLPPPAERKPA